MENIKIGDIVVYTETVYHDFIPTDIMNVCVVEDYNEKTNELLFFISLNFNNSGLKRLKIKKEDIDLATYYDINLLIKKLAEQFTYNNPSLNEPKLDDCFNWLVKQFEIYTPTCVQQTDYIKETANLMLDIISRKQFNPCTMKPFDRVLVRNNTNNIWEIDFFEQLIPYMEDLNLGETYYQYKTMKGLYNFCIPFNNNTSYLVGKTESPQPFYNII